MRELLAIVLGREGYEVVVAENGRQALDELERRPVDLLISDIHMPDMTGLDVLRTAKGMNPDLAGIMVTAFASTETAIEALRMGAYDYIHKPFNVDELKIVVTGALERRRLRRENVLLKRALGERHQFSNIIGRSESMLAVFELIETIAQTTSTTPSKLASAFKRSGGPAGGGGGGAGGRRGGGGGAGDPANRKDGVRSPRPPGRGGAASTRGEWGGGDKS